MQNITITTKDRRRTLCQINFMPNTPRNFLDTESQLNINISLNSEITAADYSELMPKLMQILKRISKGNTLETINRHSWAITIITPNDYFLPLLENACGKMLNGVIPRPVTCIKITTNTHDTTTYINRTTKANEVLAATIMAGIFLDAVLFFGLLIIFAPITLTVTIAINVLIYIALVHVVLPLIAMGITLIYEHFYGKSPIFHAAASPQATPPTTLEETTVVNLSSATLQNQQNIAEIIRVKGEKGEEVVVTGSVKEGAISVPRIGELLGVSSGGIVVGYKVRSETINGEQKEHSEMIMGRIGEQGEVLEILKPEATDPIVYSNIVSYEKLQHLPGKTTTLNNGIN